jgi:uncharacterized protein
MRRPIRRRISAIWPFYIQACFISWFGWLPALVLAPRRGYDLFSGADFFRIFRGEFVDATHVVVVVLFWFAFFGPAISAIGITHRTGGAKGIDVLWRRAIRWRVERKWYLAVVGLPIANLVPAAVVAYATGTVSEQPALPLALGLVPLFFLLQLAASGLQEVGWRGFALPYLQWRNPAEQASYLIGVLWVVWYLPYVLIVSGGPRLPFDLVGFAAYLVGSSVIYTWLYNHTASLFLVILYHTIASVAIALALGLLGTHPSLPIIVGLTTWAIAWPMLRHGLEHRTRR